MIKNVEYTNPFNGEQKILPVMCSDTQTYANGFPIPVSDDAPCWCRLFKAMPVSGVTQVYTILP